MTRGAILTLEFRSWWLSGTGGGRGRLLDAACCRDADGLPAMPMTQVKGALRETADRLARAGQAGWDSGAVERLFGRRPDEDGGSSPGAVAFLGDARIAEAERAGLLGDAAPERRGMLYRRIASTAIDDKLGAARDRTLRFVEAAAPVTLEGRLEWTAEDPPDAGWITLLDAAAAATVAFGKMKADGYGAALARAAPAGDAPAKPAPADASQELKQASRARLRLTQTRPAIFGVRSATEGAHRTHAAPTGGALLGWAARNYDDFADPSAVFHGGVRFAAAAPLARDGSECAPMPALFMAPKNEPGGGIRDGRICTEKVRVGRPATKDGAAPAQYEPVDDAPFVSPTGFAVKPARGQRLRTATRDGRAAENQLFGYEHLAPDGRPEFIATVERDAVVSDDDWERLMAAFDGRTLRLGRARGTSYGGEFECAAEPAEEDTAPVPKGERRLRVLAMSDLALTDEFGAPCVEPDHAMLDLPRARFVSADSALSLRRWAPWNAHLGTRDVERQVIEAGSVLTFELERPLDEDLPARAAIGLWRESGLGQIWIAPPFLRGDSGAAPRFGEAADAPADAGGAEKPPAGAGTSHLAKWCDTRKAREEEQGYG